MPTWAPFALALALSAGFPLLLLLALLLSRLQAGDDLGPRRTSVVVGLGILVAAVLSTLVRGLPYALVLFAPLAEEAGKVAGLAFTPRARRSAHEALVYGAMAGLAFAAAENLLYVTTDFAIAGPADAFVTGLYRMVGPVALHAACSALMGLGLWSASQRRWSEAFAWVAAAVLAHMLANAATTVDPKLSLLVDLGVAALVLAKARLSRKGTLAPA